MKVHEHAGSDKSVVLTCVDFSEELSGKQEKFCFKFGSIESAFKSLHLRCGLVARPRAPHSPLNAFVRHTATLPEVEMFRKEFSAAQDSNRELGVGAVQGGDAGEASG